MQKGESQNGFLKKTKHVKFSEKRTFLIPWYAHVRPFALLPTIYEHSKTQDKTFIESIPYHLVYVSPEI